MTEAPLGVRELAERRSRARSERDFATADRLRDEIAAQGWVVRDAADGYTLEPKPRYDVVRGVQDLPEASEPSRFRAVVTMLVEGWPDDVRVCMSALVANLPEGVGVLALDAGNLDGAGDVAQEFAEQHDTVDLVHVAEPVRFGPARAALLRADAAPIHVWLEPSTILDGDAVSPLLAAFDEDDVVGAGWRGANVDDDWRSFHDAGPGRVEAVLGYLSAVRRDAALAVAADPASPFTHARFYRNADVELSYWLRDAGGALVVVPDLPVHQTRHRGYHDTDPAYRDRESKRNYDRFLQRFRNRPDLRLP